MTDGRYIFRGCVPDGNIDITNIQTGNIIQRSWSFRVNNPPEAQQLLDAGAFDPRNILTGSDGELYDGDGNFLAEVNTWHPQINFSNTDYHAAGNKIVWAIPASFTVTLSFTETVIRDAILLKQLFDALKNGTPNAVLNFSGVVHAH